jgi:hypothetical protein
MLQDSLPAFAKQVLADYVTCTAAVAIARPVKRELKVRAILARNGVRRDNLR